ncbi:hypothetical protein YPPY58_1794, partial [Yersinia pestis PY-58]
MVSCSDNQS